MQKFSKSYIQLIYALIFKMRKNTTNTIYTEIIKDSVLMIGDIHGAFNRLKDLIWKKQIENCCLICVGDLGIGFNPSSEGEINKIKELNDFFSKRSIEFLSIAGNHDDPSYFNGSIDLSHFKLLPDYTRIKINGEEFLFVGGAISIDRLWRVPNLSYWHDEPFVLKPDLAGKCDVLVTHSAPYWNGPFDKQGLAIWCEKDSGLWDECHKERMEHDELIKLCQPQKHYCGHFHSSNWTDFRECLSTILSIEEIKEHR